MIRKLGIVAILFLMFAAPVFAQEELMEEKEGWEFYFAPYVWVPSLEADITQGSHSVSSEMSFDEILENLDGVTMLDYGVRKDRFSINGNILSLGLEKDLPTKLVAGANRSTELKAFFSQVTLGYDLIEKKPVGKSMALSLTPVVGVRYNNIRTTIDKINGGELSDSTMTFWDALIGANVTLYINEKWALSGNGLVGGFDWGSSSKLTWSLGGFVNYRLSEKSVIRAGYAHVDIDLASPDLDLKVSGPAVQYVYRF